MRMGCEVDDGSGGGIGGIGRAEYASYLGISFEHLATCRGIIVYDCGHAPGHGIRSAVVQQHFVDDASAGYQVGQGDVVNFEQAVHDGVGQSAAVGAIASHLRRAAKAASSVAVPEVTSAACA